MAGAMVFHKLPLSKTRRWDKTDIAEGRAEGARFAEWSRTVICAGHARARARRGCVCAGQSAEPFPQTRTGSASRYPHALSEATGVGGTPHHAADQRGRAESSSAFVCSGALSEQRAESSQQRAHAR